MRRAAFALAWAFALTSCAAPLPPADTTLAAPPAVFAAAPATACQIGPQDGPVAAPPENHAAAPPPGPKSAAVAAPFEVADSGIGGTGGGVGPNPLPPVVPAPPGRPTSPVDRGIGGTGPATTSIGPTITGSAGIVGVITGFASLCVDGLEVGYGTNIPVLADADGTPTTLRAGQLALIAATRRRGTLQADQVTIRHEVIGPVDSTDTDGMMSIAGQLVQATAQTRGTAAPTLGDWVAVSGLRRPDGVIAASRIDPANPGRVWVHGLLGHDAAGPSIGALELHVPRDIELPSGGAVTAAGGYLAGVLYVETLVPDLFQTDPSTAFGPETSDFYVESMAAFGFGGVDYDEPRFGGDPEVLRFSRQADGSLYGRAAFRASGFAPLAPGVQPAGRPYWQRSGPSMAGRRGFSPQSWRSGFTPVGGRREAGSEPAPVPGGARRDGGGGGSRLGGGGGGGLRGGGRRPFNVGGQAPFGGGFGPSAGPQGPPGH